MTNKQETAANMKEAKAKIKSSIKEIVRHIDDFAKMSKYVYSLGKNYSGYKFQDDVVIGRQQMKGLQTALKDEVKSLAGEFVKLSKTRRRTAQGQTKPGVGLRQPLVLTQDTRNFLNAGDFGLADPSDPNSVPLLESLEFLMTNNISNRTQLALLIKTYCYVNGLTIEGQGGFMKADELMNKHLNKAFYELEKHYKNNGKSFDRNRFSWTDLNSLSSFLAIPYKALGEKDMDVYSKIYDPQVDNEQHGSRIGNQMNQESETIKTVNLYYKTQGSK